MSPRAHLPLLRQTNVFCIVLGPSVVSFVHMRTTPLSSRIPARIIRRYLGSLIFNPPCQRTIDFTPHIGWR